MGDIDETKFKVFLEIAGALNKNGITPILFGSLGLSRIIKQSAIDDIDIVLPNGILVDDFERLEQIMSEIGFSRDIYYKHEFIRNDERVGFEEESDITNVHISLETLKETVIGNVQFFELSATEYLGVYMDTLVRWKKKVKSIEEKVNALKKIK